MVQLCEDCGEEPCQADKAICKWCDDYREYRARLARAVQQYELSLLDRELDCGG